MKLVCLFIYCSAIQPSSKAKNYNITPLDIMLNDLTATLKLLKNGKTHPQDEIERAIDAASSERCDHVFLTPTFESARKTAKTPDILNTPLCGLAVSTKDLFDVKGQTTCAGSVALLGAPPAEHDSLAVARMRRAGAAFVGRTNMSEFAFSGVGINPHYGTPANACSGDVRRIPGGSSSGAAISVATGAAWIGLGTDTGGSIRIPAALNGIVGFKSTARLVPTDGVLPLSSTLDTVCALTKSVADAILAHEILAQRRVIRSAAPLNAYRLGVPTNLMLDTLDPHVARAWQRSLEILHDCGANIVELPLSEINQLQQIQANGGFSQAESYAWHRQLLKNKVQEYDPRVATRIMKGATMSACDYIDLKNAREAWIKRMDSAILGFDALLSPTVPIVAPPISELAPGFAQDDVFFRVNAELLRNPSVVNMFDGCAISIPCQTLGELPVGLMIWAGAMRDEIVLNIALQIEKVLPK
jgi:aspartyl-tRNA(Asn)/glutamyl-tRNA(Gln) amidotransferase subunit A